MKNSEFRNLPGYNIHVVSHFLQNIYNEKLGEHDLTHAQSKVIFFLAKYGKQSQTELQNRLFIRPSSMNGIIDSLLKHGRISKEPSEHDKRTKMVALTQAGHDLKEIITDIIQTIEEQLTAGIPEEEIIAMVSTLQRMQDNMRPDCHRRDSE
ncbi:MarR family winged helix-turn-helix transcriptional regulator [Halobacillus salinus]|uniref:MarR family transcriptional regulator n=1 Tax=Halobacillus salinus TaxID=192814 RepID=A0A4Z0GXJ0_9BACI|nr:MarR family winged helix-turn-helix transcriptional regulator [Halobacillus salinus]TGB01850.1 MarR family transcriptional regulator [Halobacillus salinus]